MDMKLRGATALITGARRLGREIALGLAREGTNVALCYRVSRDAAEHTARQARDYGVQALALPADAADAEQMEDLVSRVLPQLGPIDLLVAGAGAFRRTPFRTLTESDWDEMMRDNLDVFLVPATRIGRRMKARGGGCIIALADIAALRPWADYAPYSIAKSGVVALAHGLARELAPEVRVNAIAPGPILFPADGDATAFRREIERTLLKRHGESTDIVQAVLFLAQAEFVTGIVLPVDGGRLLVR